MSAIIITINLLGQISQPIKHTTKQVCTVSLDKGKKLTRKILHSNRGSSLSTQVTKIEESIVDQWVNTCPNWENFRNWNKKNTKERILSYVNTFDEGFGVSYQELSCHEE